MVKRFLICAVVLFGVLINTSCNKEEKMSVTYPPSGVYGENVLALADSSSLIEMTPYSLCAELGEKAELKIVINQLSGPGTWFYAEKNGWTVSSYSGGTQQFESNTDGKIDLDIVFGDGPGSCRIDYYENSSTMTNSKTLIW